MGEPPSWDSACANVVIAEATSKEQHTIRANTRSAMRLILRKIIADITVGWKRGRYEGGNNRTLPDCSWTNIVIYQKNKWLGYEMNKYPAAVFR
ncbi:MAG: hypothetical protein NPIRA03_14210 [Nitrospirales bacterium]|nr:MAG: hypothetical protein NPIRA03_14210 [Nitrospirales bacterium]